MVSTGSTAAPPQRRSQGVEGEDMRGWKQFRQKEWTHGLTWTHMITLFFLEVLVVTPYDNVYIFYIPYVVLRNSTAPTSYGVRKK